LGESGGGWEEVQGGVRAVEIVVVEVEREAGSAVITGVVRASIGPLAGEGLDESFGLAIGLGAIRAGEAMLEAELVTGGGKEIGAIGGAAIGEDGLDGDAVVLIKGERLVEGGEDAGDFFVGEERGGARDPQLSAATVPLAPRVTAQRRAAGHPAAKLNSFGNSVGKVVVAALIFGAAYLPPISGAEAAGQSRPDA